MWRRATGRRDRHLNLPSRRWHRGAGREAATPADGRAGSGGSQPGTPRRWVPHGPSTERDSAAARWRLPPPFSFPGSPLPPHHLQPPPPPFLLLASPPALYLRGRPGPAGRRGGCRWTRCGWRSSAASSGAGAATCRRPPLLWGRGAQARWGGGGGVRCLSARGGASAGAGRGELCFCPGVSVIVEVSGGDTEPRNL